MCSGHHKLHICCSSQHITSQQSTTQHSTLLHHNTTQHSICCGTSLVCVVQHFRVHLYVMSSNIYLSRRRVRADIYIVPRQPSAGYQTTNLRCSAANCIGHIISKETLANDDCMISSDNTSVRCVGTHAVLQCITGRATQRVHGLAT